MLPDSSTLMLFVIAAMALLLAPGPNVIYIMTRSVSLGLKAGLVSAVGIGIGTLCHIGAAVLGLSALLASSALAFAIVKYAGAAYLIYLGLRTLFARNGAQQQIAPPPVIGLRRVLVQGILVNVLNPKVALFFLAFLPQFVDPSRGNAAGQTLVLGLILAALGTLTDGGYALLAGMLGRRLSGQGQGLQRIAGGVYLALGVTTALTGSSNH